MKPAPASVVCLGVGDGFLSPDRGHAAFLYRFGDTQLLVDCGEPAARSLRRLGAGADDLDGVVISHLHFDHVGGLLTLLQAHWLGPRPRPFPVYLPRSGRKPLEALVRDACLQDPPRPLPVQFVPWKPGQPESIGKIRVTPHPSSHLEVLADPGMRNGRSRQAFSLVLEGYGRRVAHSADIGSVADLEPLVREPLDLLVCELSHVEPDAVFPFLTGREIRRTVFVHLAGSWWKQRRTLLSKARRTLAPMPVFIPADGERFTF